MPGRPVQLRIGGQTYRVITSADEEELARLTAMVEEKLTLVVAPGKPMTPQALLLAALALAHDLEVEKGRTAALTDMARGAFGRILRRVDTALDATAGAAKTPSGAR
jgi:cell division protein ZapA